MRTVKEVNLLTYLKKLSLKILNENGKRNLFTCFDTFIKKFKNYVSPKCHQFGLKYF